MDELCEDGTFGKSAVLHELYSATAIADSFAAACFFCNPLFSSFFYHQTGLYL